MAISRNLPRSRIVSAVPALVVFLIAAPVGFALNPNRTRVVNLDSDPEPERIVPRQLCETPNGTLSLPAPICLTDQFVQRRIESSSNQTAFLNGQRRFVDDRPADQFDEMWCFGEFGVQMGQQCG